MTSNNWKGYVYEHIIVAEKLMNRQLREDEEVHHLDFNRANNHPSNLLVLEKSQHTKLHSYLKYGSKEYKQCIVCNSQTDYTCCSSRCKALNKRVVKNRPTKEELLKLLTDHSYVEVGKMFKVSDNSIRKWLKSKNEE